MDQGQTSTLRQAFASLWAQAKLDRWSLWGCVFIAIYVTFITIERLVPSLLPWVAETDWKQWLWMYHRYSTPGAFPPGQLLTDYAMAVQPPLYWLGAATLSTLSSPVVAATLLYALALVMAVWGAARATAIVSPFAMGMALLMLSHDGAFHRYCVGGYPRSFGPALVLVFLALWRLKKDAWVMVSLVVMAAVYPSVAVPCGLAFGAASLVRRAQPDAHLPKSAMPSFITRHAWLLLTAIAVGALAQMQSLFAPDWWGSVVTLAEAQEMAALGPQGRTPWVPLLPFWEKSFAYLNQPFAGNGWLVHWQWMPWTRFAPAALWAGFVVVVVMAARRVGALSLWRSIPKEPLWLMAASLLSFALAQVLAFKLYLPHRMVQHVLPFAVVVWVPSVLWLALQAWLGTGTKLMRAMLLVVPLTLLAVSGDGTLQTGLRSYASRAPLYTWVKHNTAVTDQFAGTLAVLDELPFFAERQAFVNWKMAHPFRKGFYAEIERRILAMYDAVYATDVDGLLAFAEAEHIAYFAIDTDVYEAVEQGDGQLFSPLREQVLTLFEQRQARGFAITKLPAMAVVFREGDVVVVSVERLKQWRATNAAAP